MRANDAGGWLREVQHGVNAPGWSSWENTGLLAPGIIQPGVNKPARIIRANFVLSRPSLRVLIRGESTDSLLIASTFARFPINVVRSWEFLEEWLVCCWKQWWKEKKKKTKKKKKRRRESQAGSAEERTIRKDNAYQKVANFVRRDLQFVFEQMKCSISLRSWNYLQSTR